MRCSSADNRKEGADVRPQRRLEEHRIVEREVIIARPKGYKPKYLRPMRKVQFIEDDGLAEDLNTAKASEGGNEAELTDL